MPPIEGLSAKRVPAGPRRWWSGPAQICGKAGMSVKATRKGDAASWTPFLRRKSLDRRSPSGFLSHPVKILIYFIAVLGRDGHGSLPSVTRLVDCRLQACAPQTGPVWRQRCQRTVSWNNSMEGITNFPEPNPPLWRLSVPGLQQTRTVAIEKQTSRGGRNG